MRSIIKIQGLTKKYKSKNVLHELRLEVNEHEFLGIIGNNGAGKSTLIKILSNVLDYDSGEINFFDSSDSIITAKEFKRNLGIILDQSFLIEELTQFEYLSFIGQFQNVPKNQIKSRIEDLEKILSLEDINKPISKLSSGNKMKVALAAAIIHNPKVLILDEPFINLDINSISNLTKILGSFIGKKTLLISSHSLDLITELCDRFLIIDNGILLGNFSKADFNSVQELKDTIKKIMINENASLGLDWLI